MSYYSVLEFIEMPGSMLLTWSHWRWDMANYIHQFLWYPPSLACRCTTSWLCTHTGMMGMPTGMIRASAILQMPELGNHQAESIQIKRYGYARGHDKGSWNLTDAELSNHWADSLKIKFFRTVLAHRCATSWSCALRCLTGVIRAFFTLFTECGTLQWSACFC